MAFQMLRARLRRAPGVTVALGLALIGLGAAGFVLPPHSIALAILGGAAGTVPFVLGVRRLSGNRPRWLPLAGLLSCGLLVITLGLLVNQVALVAFGHEVRCPVRDRYQVEHTNRTGHSFVAGYTVDCPDGTYMFEIAESIDPTDGHDVVVMVAAPTSLIQRRPRVLAHQAFGWFAYPVAPLLVAAVVVAAVRRRRVLRAPDRVEG